MASPSRSSTLGAVANAYAVSEGAAAAPSKPLPQLTVNLVMTLFAQELQKLHPHAEPQSWSARHPYLRDFTWCAVGTAVGGGLLGIAQAVSGTAQAVLVSTGAVSVVSFPLAFCIRSLFRCGGPDEIDRAPADDLNLLRKRMKTDAALDAEWSRRSVKVDAITVRAAFWGGVVGAILGYRKSMQVNEWRSRVTQVREERQDVTRLIRRTVLELQEETQRRQAALQAAQKRLEDSKTRKNKADAQAAYELWKRADIVLRRKSA